MNFGAFVKSCQVRKDWCIYLSSHNRVEKVEDVVSVGDEIGKR